MHSQLNAFISSTADLVEERKAIACALAALHIDGSCFEVWTSSPNQPITECLLRIDASDAFVLILGSRYGTELPDGLSFTHQEYRHARQTKRPIFVFLMDNTDAEAKQADFIEEVRRDRFICKPIRTIAKLKEQVTNSFLQEVTRCFRSVHSPPMVPPFTPRTPTADSGVAIPDSVAAVRLLLADLNERGDDAGIRSLADDCELTFADDQEIMQFIFAAEVNLGINGTEVDRNKVGKAIEFWNHLLRQKSDHTADIRYNLGNALAVLQRFDAAVEQYKAALDEEPGLAKCWKNLGSIHSQRGDFSEARRCFEQAAKIQPQMWRVLYSLATLTIQEGGDPELALSWMSRIATKQIPPGKAAAVHAWMAEMYGTLGRYAEGIASAEDALSLDPEPQWAWMGAARLYSLARRMSPAWLPDAIHFWRRFTAKHSHMAEGWAEFGYAMWAIGEHAEGREQRREALPLFEKALELGFSDDGLVEDRVGHIYQAEENWEEAERFFRKAAAKNEPQFGYCLGVSLIFLGRYAEALPLVQHAAEKHQSDALSWFQVARCHEGLENSNEAIKAYERALKLDESYADAWFNLGGVLWNSGDRERAFEVWQNACRRFPEYDRTEELCDFIALALLAEGADDDRTP